MFADGGEDAQASQTFLDIHYSHASLLSAMAFQKLPSSCSSYASGLGAASRPG